MGARKRNQDGLATERSALVLLIIDVINPLDFPEAGQLLRYIPALTRRISRLKKRARAAGVPVVYVNR
jgi:nicotinamidase-related amidase